MIFRDDWQLGVCLLLLLAGVLVFVGEVVR